MIKHIVQIQSEFLRISSKLTKQVTKAKRSKKPVVFLGGSVEDNTWRKDLKNEFKDVIFLDPYDKNWEPEKNIYDECAALAASDNVVFYNSGKLSEKEQDFLETIDGKYKEFDDIDKLKSYIRRIA